MLPVACPLHILAPGQRARIAEVLGPPDDVRRLHELGLRQGVMVEMVQPGRPCIVRLDGHQLCFRGEELMRILVQPGEVA